MRCQGFRFMISCCCPSSARANSSASSRCRRHLIRRPTCCCVRSAAALTTSSTWAWAISRSTGNRGRSPGASLGNTPFVLDEPSIGLHPRDMRRVISVMKRLRDAGNSLLVVEHDPQIMLEADRILDMGPGAGERGGGMGFFGSPAAIKRSARSLTGEYLSGRKLWVTPRAARAPSKEPIAEWRPNRWLELRGARAHNLKNIDVRIPLKRLVCVTGVSGSGKSPLVEDVLYPALLKYQGRPSEAPGEFDGLRGADLLADVVMVDPHSVGRTTRSNPAKIGR